MTLTFDEQVAVGIWRYAGEDDDGEPLLSFDEDVARELAPDLYWQNKNSVDEAVLDAIDAGYLEWDFDPETFEETLIVTPLGELV